MIEGFLAERLAATIDDFDMEEFGAMLEARPDEVTGDVFDTLMTFSDFAEFKGLMLAYKGQDASFALEGSAGGFGFATGLAFTREILLPTPELPLTAAGVSGYGEIALVGLSDGLFGALIGIGFAAALDARSHAKRALVGVGGLLAAIAMHLLYDALAKGAPFSDSAMVRKWAALLLPVLVVIATVVVALRFEKGAIAEELASEAETGAVTTEDLGVLQSWLARQKQYLGRLAKFDFGGWSALHSLHNRQVQLALAKRKVAKETDAEARAENAGEVAALRQSVLELKQRLGASGGQEASP